MCVSMYAVTLNIVIFFHDFIYKLLLVSLFYNQVNVHLLLTVVFFFKLTLFFLRLCLVLNSWNTVILVWVAS